jgi:hypothetical protein
MSVPVHVMVDSGAYSVKSGKVEIDVRTYSDFIEKVHSRVWAYVGLDIIPGEHGGIFIPGEYATAAAASFRNYQYMRCRGLHPIPVVHQGESVSWLDRYLDAGATYVGLARRAKFGRDVQRDWLDQAFTRLTDEAGKPLVKVHGFGITAPELVARYPWSSFDSATWIRQAGYGRIIVPSAADGAGEYDFFRPHYIAISDRQDRSPLQQAIRRYVEQECGFPLEAARRRASTRAAINLQFYQRMSAAFDGKFVVATDHLVSVSKLTVHRHQVYRLLSFARLK